MTFLSWLYPFGARQLTTIAQSVLLLEYDFFSIELSLKTLFQPWRRDIENPINASLQQLVQAMSMNMVSRLLGLGIRLMTILIGLFCLIFTLMVGVPILVVMTTAPVSIPLLILLALVTLTSSSLAWVAIITLIIVVVAGAILVIIYQEAKLNPPHYQTLAQALSNNSSIEQLKKYLDLESAKLFNSSNTTQEFVKSLLTSKWGRLLELRLSLDPQTLLSQNISPAITLSNLLLGGAKLAVSSGHIQVTICDLIGALINSDPGFKSLTTSADLSDDDLQRVFNWMHTLWLQEHPLDPLLSPSTLRTSGGIGRDWSSGYTRLLNQYASELTETVTGLHLGDHFQAHKDSIDELERILSRASHQNAILIGDTGVGKKTTVLGLSDRIASGASLRPLRHKKVFSVDISALLASSEGSLEQRLIMIFNEAASAGNVVLFFDGIERLFGSSMGEIGSIDASEILLPYLRSSAVQLIGSTDFSSFNRYIENRSEISSALEKIEIAEPSIEDSVSIACEVVGSIEGRSGVAFTYQAIREAVNAASRYLPDRRFPQKAIDLLDELAVFASADKGVKVVTPEIVDELVSQKTHVKVGRPEDIERQTLLNLEDILHKRLINQSEAVKGIAEAMRRSRAGVSSNKRPVGSFLLLGPTGVGKTETAKTLAQAYFGSEESMIRLDMSEYQSPDGLLRLIGNDQTGEPGQLTTAVKERPFSLILLDEIEKAYTGILDLFLQVLDDGRLTDAMGQTIDFTSSIIIATSNAGSNLIREKISSDINKGAEIDMIALKKQLLEHIQNEGIFRPEFLNRFDAVVAYRPLTLLELEQVVAIMLKNLNTQLAEKGIVVNLTEPAVAKLARLGFDPEFGARALRRTMTQTVENVVADQILANKLSRGSTITLDEGDIDQIQN